ncbi:DNA mismatch repair protein MutS [Thermoactinomyces intermedius]|uniref:DNA mismatch repair protein MutS n=1 Tax=Thermoactinomyces intermedius TaxID=2024 RepID=A0A8I1ADR3_THEIN|nr:DNA mismatch repair protein MutS [Thermoactinomyces intermedius]MBA4837228.1 DNA mismatch repair protein MutS [Thermoactinomyces intermedius]MBH8595991.1 DNA mismatch repair protein MutS [Thermoactinomyces intermedius]
MQGRSHLPWRCRPDGRIRTAGPRPDLSKRRAVYAERCTYGSERGSEKPAVRRRQGALFLLYFEDAEKAAEELEITLTSRDGGSERIPMCGVPYHSAHTYVEKLIDQGYKVAICEQVEDPSAAKGVVKREVVRVITPGTIMEENMLVDQENNFLVTLTGSANQMALAAVDLSTGECHITEMGGSLDGILDEISSYQPKEIVLDVSLAEQAAVKEQIETRLKCLITPHDLDAGSEKKLSEELPAQFPQYPELCDTPFLRKVVALLFSYLKQTQKRALHHLQRLHRYDAKQYMMLDEAARRNLELTATLGEGKKKGSLLWLLDQTATAMGSRLLKKWLDKPLLSLEEITRRQNMVEALLSDFLLLDEVRDRMKQVYDLERLAARISYGSANARDLNSVKRSLSIIPELKEKLLQSDSRPLKELAEKMDELTDVKNLIDEALVEEAPVSVKEGGIIREGFHEKLDQLRKIQKDGKSWIAELEQKERDLTGIKSLKIRYNRVFGYYIEVTKSNLHLVPKDRYHRKQTLANSERYITPELKEREQLILNASERSVELEYELFTKVRDQVAAQVQRLQSLAGRVAELDVLHAFALIAQKYQYVRPKVHTGSQLKIKAGRHPVVEAVNHTGEFVANDAELDQENRQVLLVTGPNMAGKSTYMRQVALIVILSQIGSFVPAEEAEISIVDRVFTRIGAADDLTGGRSTFMVEMSETCHALKEATRRSLILLDEVGRGTSTYDGMALAHAIVEYIHDHVGAKTLFSTHYHELTKLEESLSRLKNVHAQCIERNGKVVFLHRIVPGGADRSYGIQVAELAGLPKEVITRAKQLLAELENGTPGASNTGVSPDSSGQLSLFDPLEIQPAARETAASSLTPEEQEILEAVRKWDLMNKTPFECMQFLHEIKQKLN